jgi:enoyl-CoA hydratase
MMPTEQFIRTAGEGPLYLITLDHPPMNAFHPLTLDQLDGAVEEFLANPAFKVAIIYGGDQAVFSAGADIFEFNHLFESGQVMDFVHHGQLVFQKIYESPKPFIAAVNGLALGGAFELMLACHFRILAERAKIGLPEIDLGIIPGWGGTQRLSRIIGQAKALELILTGESISAQQAQEWNLVNKVVPRAEVLPAAKELATKIAQKSDPAVRAALDAIRACAQLPLSDGLSCEAGQFAGLIDSQKVRESLRAISEKQRTRRGR